MAKILTYPERVHRYNYDKLKNLILRGSEKHPGANIVYKKNEGEEDEENN
jgi:DNA-directed RNA polymerase III subunit RPC1